MIEIEGMIPSGSLKKVEVIPGVVSAKVRADSNGHLKVGILAKNPRKQMPEIIKVLSDAGAQLDYISPGEITLEDVFVNLTGRALSEDTREVISEVKNE